MTARVLQFTREVREAALDVRSHREKLRSEGHEWAPALANANARMIALARGEDKQEEKAHERS